ncbi:hypothetical protein AB0878_37760 [Amycolatopsis sp. NPDC047767]|uniref:hypothetical protein n=1 Tax=Amycolatopsis sp. NPDC047767 TaxID=3156765 RepID=UPI00345405D7
MLSGDLAAAIPGFPRRDAQTSRPPGRLARPRPAAGSVWGFCIRCFCFARLNSSCFCFAYFGSSADFTFFSGFDAFGDSARRSRSLATLRFGLNVRSHIVSAGHPGTSFADFARFSLSLAAVCARLVVRSRGLSIAGYFGASVADLARFGLGCSAVFFGFDDFALSMLSCARLSLGRVGFARFGARGSNPCGRS